MSTTADQRAADHARLETVRSHDAALQQTTLAELLNTPLPPREALLEGLLKMGESMMLWAAPGVGKTMASLSIALAVAGGGRWLHWAAPRPRRVLIVDGEMNMHDLRDRFAALAQGAAGGDMAAAGENITLVARQGQHPDCEFPDIGDRNWQRQIIERAQREGADLVILDNLSTLAVVEDENSASATSPVVQFLMRMKAAGLAVILVHHAGKSGETYRGSSNLATTFEVIAGLATPKDATSLQGTAFDLSFGKYRGKRTDAHAETTAWLIEGDRTGALRWDWKKSDTAIINQMVAAVLTGEFATDRALAKHLDMSTSKLSRWRAKGIRLKAITAEQWKEAQQEGAKAAREAFSDEADDDTPTDNEF